MSKHDADYYIGLTGDIAYVHEVNEGALLLIKELQNRVALLEAEVHAQLSIPSEEAPCSQPKP